MIIPIKQILINEITGATANYQNLVPKKSLPKTNPIIPSENASRMVASSKATGIGTPTSNVASKMIEIKTKEIAKASSQSSDQ